MNIEELKLNGLILLEAIVGSTAYGMNTPESDIDKNYIFMAPMEELLGLDYTEQVNENNNDTTAYELGKYMKLLQTANPTVVSLLFTPDEFILYKHPVMDRLFEIRDKFIVKKMKYTFGSYAQSQITKASGLQKKMNWEKERTERKSILDFCYTPVEHTSQNIKFWLQRGLKQEYCGLSSIPNMRYSYALFYDVLQHFQKEKVEWDSPEFRLVISYYNYDNPNSEDLGDRNVYERLMKDEVNFKYKGIVQDLEKSNDVSLSSIPQGEVPLATIMVNLDGYQQHCGEFKQYQTWLKERNTARYTDIAKHGQSYDGKNLSHCVRLLRMSKEISEGKGLIIKRPDAEYLKSIRRGEVDLKELLNECNNILANSEDLFENSTLEDSVDKDFVNQLLIKIRKEFYQRQGLYVTEDTIIKSQNL